MSDENDDLQDAVDVAESFGLDVSDLVEREDDSPEPQEAAQAAQQPDQGERARQDEMARQRWQSSRARRESSGSEELVQRIAAMQQTIDRLAQGYQPSQQPRQQDQRGPEFEGIDPQAREYFEHLHREAIAAQDQRLQAYLGPILERFRAEDQQRALYIQHQRQMEARQAHVNGVIAEVNEYAAENPAFQDDWQWYDQAYTSSLQRLGLPQQAIATIKAENALGMAALARQYGFNPGYLTHVFIQEALAAAGSRNGARAQQRHESRAQRNAQALSQPIGGRRANAGSVADEQLDGRQTFTQSDARKLSTLTKSKGGFNDLIAQLAMKAESR